MRDYAAVVVVECPDVDMTTVLEIRTRGRLGYIHTLALPTFPAAIDSTAGIAGQLCPDIPSADFLKVCLQRSSAGTRHTTPRHDTLRNYVFTNTS